MSYKFEYILKLSNAVIRCFLMIKLEKGFPRHIVSLLFVRNSLNSVKKNWNVIVYIVGSFLSHLDIRTAPGTPEGWRSVG